MWSLKFSSHCSALGAAAFCVGELLEGVAALWAEIVSEGAEFLVDKFEKSEPVEEVEQRDEHEGVDHEPTDEGGDEGACAEGFELCGEECDQRHPQEDEDHVEEYIGWFVEPSALGAAE